MEKVDDAVPALGIGEDASECSFGFGAERWQELSNQPQRSRTSRLRSRRQRHATATTTTTTTKILHVHILLPTLQTVIDTRAKRSLPPPLLPPRRTRHHQIPSRQLPRGGTAIERGGKSVERVAHIGFGRCETCQGCGLDGGRERWSETTGRRESHSGNCRGGNDIGGCFESIGTKHGSATVLLDGTAIGAISDGSARFRKGNDLLSAHSGSSGCEECHGGISPKFIGDSPSSRHRRKRWNYGK
mmetsp:Transcript_29461/g.57033  ORF Transcript_29461/g.57033 Transcript_29461/m.57033 type:complete len:244 (-) Transcript_29461:1226-1957(-)